MVREGKRFLREKLGSVQADNERIASIIGARSQLNEESVSELFLEARTKDPAFAKSGGIIHDIRDVQLPTGTPVHQLVFDR